MSDWTNVTSKKKPPSGEPADPTRASTPSEPSAQALKTRVRAEFIIKPGHKTFNPVLALRGLLQTMAKDFPTITFSSVSGAKTVSSTSDIPEDQIKFKTLFPVYPHLRPNGGGKVHVHFCIPASITIERIKQSTDTLTYLQRQQIWLTPHKFMDGQLATAGYIFMKSPSLTHISNYIKTLKTHLLQTNPSITDTPQDKQ